MNTIPLVDCERKVQNRVVNLLHDYCGYQYLGYKKDDDNSPIIPEILSRFLKETQGATQSEIDKIIRLLESEISRCHDKDSLFDSNLKIYEYLRYGVNIQKEDGSGSTTYRLINWDKDDFAENNFALAEEVTVCRNIPEYHTRRPDVVIYINGIAVGVIELKKSTVSVKDGIRQNIRNNSKDNEICHFFATAQFLYAGNDSEGVYYGTILTPEKFWLRWKEPTGQSYASGNAEPDEVAEKYPRREFPNELDRSLLQMLEPERLLTLIHDCVVFDGGVKKVCRPNQYFAFEAAKPRIERKQNGIIWHSQGAGKSLMMVWLAQWILENMPRDPRVVIITDRDELDKQIENGFKDAGESPVRAKSGKHLLQLLSLQDPNTPNPKLICTLIHKFGIAGQEETAFSPEDRKLLGKRSPEQYMEALAAKLPKDFKAKGNIYVFVDECHRTQGGVLNRAMKKIMGDDVMLIGFTGTPLLKYQKQKLTSRENFGQYIHTYKFNEAVEDRVVLDLRYEAREVEQNLEDEASVDQLFEDLSRGLSLKAKDELQKRWAMMKHLFSSKDRINKIVADIVKDMTLIPCLRDGWGNAMLVCESIYQAYRYWDAFQNTPLKGHCAVVSSFDGKDADPSESSSGETQSEAEYKAEKAKAMFGGKTVEEFEEWAKAEFVDHPGKLKLLIVVNKLLTGFDAPSATYLYLDKKMEGHDLFQAICRVNRPNNENEEKLYGYIVDYKQLFENINDAIDDYTKGAFSDFEKEDVDGLLNNRFEEARKDLDAALERVEQLCEPVKAPKKIDQFFDYFVFDQATTKPDDEQVAIFQSAPKRELLYGAVNKLVACHSAIALDMEKAGYTTEDGQNIFERVKNFHQIVQALMLRAGEKVDMKSYDQKMRSILDTYVEAKHSKVIEKLEDFSFIDLVEDGDDDELREAEEATGGRQGVASTIVANVRRVINRKRDSNPEEYKKFSERINRLLEEYHQKELEYKDFLHAVAELARELGKKTGDPRLNTAGKQALFDNLGEDIDLTIDVYDTIRQNAKVGFRSNPIKQAKLRRSLIALATQKPFDIDAIMNIAIHQPEF